MVMWGRVWQATPGGCQHVSFDMAAVNVDWGGGVLLADAGCRQCALLRKSWGTGV